MQPITGILIDPEAHTFTRVPYTDYKSISRHLNCRLFDAVRLNAQGDCVYVDDEGMINGTPFGFELDDRTLAGRGLILGCNLSTGDTTSPQKITIQWCLDNIRMGVLV